MKRMHEKNKIIVGIVVAIVAVLVMVLITNGTTNSELREHILLGDKYLEDLEYEQAIVEYLLALEIDPNNKKVQIGVEKACLQYADVTMKNITDTSSDQLGDLMIVLENSYQVTLLDSIQEKIIEVKTIIDQGQKKIAEEKRVAEEEEKRQEHEKKEKEKKIECYKFMLEDIFKEEHFVYIDVEEKEDKFIFTVTYGPSLVTKIVIEMEKNTEQGIVIEHKEEEWTGSAIVMNDVPLGKSLVGYIYDLTITEAVMSEYTAYTEHLQELERLSNVYSEYVSSYVTQNFKTMDDDFELIARNEYPEFERIDILIQNLEFKSKKIDISQKYVVEINIYLEEKRAEIKNYKSLESDGMYHKQTYPFEKEISLVDVE